jgi:hypothetical protein
MKSSKFKPARLELISMTIQLFQNASLQQFNADTGDFPCNRYLVDGVELSQHHATESGKPLLGL